MEYSCWELQPEVPALQWGRALCAVTELCSSCWVAAAEAEPAVGNVYHPALNEAITLQSQL